MNEDQLYDAAEREMDLYRDEIARITAERDEAREQLAVLRERIANTAAGMKLSAQATAPSKKSAIETECAGTLLGLLEPS